MPKCQGTPCLKQARDMKDKGLQRYSTLQPFKQAVQMSELCWDYFFVECISLYVLVISCTRFRVNPQTIVAWMSRNSWLEQAQYLKIKWLQRYSNPKPHSRSTKINRLSKLVNEYLLVWCNWLFFSDHFTYAFQSKSIY